MKVTKIKQVESNVDEFRNKAAKAYGRLHEEEFDLFIYHCTNDLGISSPIEEIFFTALRLQCAEIDYEFNTDKDLPENTEFRFILSAFPQEKIGKFKVDFLLELIHPKERTKLVIELDGHNFHDKDKHQRSYEKARDRFLLQSGYKVFHYTGGDVVSRPHHVAFEVMKYLGAILNGETIEEHDPHNRLGWQDA